MSWNSRPRPRRALVLAGAWAASVACQEMVDQPRYEPFERSDFFADGRSARPQVPGTIARGQLRLDDHLYRGRVGGEVAQSFPFPITREILDRGRQRFNIFCAPCHGQVGRGDGVIVGRGFRRAPPSYHIGRLQQAPPGHFFDVITNGFGTMVDLADRLSPADRWATVAYIRALQLSQGAQIADVPLSERERLRESQQ